MNHIKRFLGAVAPSLVMILSTTPVAALSLKEFQKFSEQERVHFVSAAVSMTAYIHAANGETAKAHCIAKWYFGTAGSEGKGPDQMATEISVAKQPDPEKYHIEGIVLGLTEKVCGQKRQGEQ